MFFKKTTPEAPSISNEQEYIAWFIEYSDKVAHIRKLYKKNLSKFVAACTKGAMKMMADYPTGDDLFERIGDLSAAYEKEMKPLVNNRGGLEHCPSELQGAVVSLLMNIFVGIEMLEKKHKHKESIELFKAIN